MIYYTTESGILLFFRMRWINRPLIFLFRVSKKTVYSTKIVRIQFLGKPIDSKLSREYTKHKRLAWTNIFNCKTIMMTSSNEKFSALLALCEGNPPVTVDSLTKACDSELWCFLWSAPKQTAEQTIETPVIWDAIVFIMTLLWWHSRVRLQRGQFPVAPFTNMV